MKKLALYKCFNPRTHTGCDLLGKVLTTRLYSFQSTHPHGVRLLIRQHRARRILFQSTHPHGVRRDSFGGAFNDIAVSIHAPTRGATRGRISGIHVHYTFQSTHPHGVRLRVVMLTCQFRGFNPRTHTGCDHQDSLGLLYSAQFQSTHPHGVRREITILTNWRTSFNPRTHTGCDSNVV